MELSLNGKITKGMLSKKSKTQSRVSYVIICIKKKGERTHQWACRCVKITALKKKLSNNVFFLLGHRVGGRGV